MTHVLQISLDDWDETYNLDLIPGEEEKLLRWLESANEEMQSGVNTNDRFFTYALIPRTALPINLLSDLVSELREIHSIEAELTPEI